MEIKIIEVDPEELKANPFQPETRISVDPVTAEKFGLSIIYHGLDHRPIVREKDGTYEVGDGWRRRAGYLWASNFVTGDLKQKYEKMPVEVRELDDQAMADMIKETNDTVDRWTDIDKALFYAKYLERFPNITQTELAARHNISQPEIANTMRLLELPADVRQLIISRKITGTHGLRLLQLDDKVMVAQLANEAVEKSLSVAALDARVKEILGRRQPRMIEPETEPEKLQRPQPEPMPSVAERHAEIAAAEEEEPEEREIAESVGISEPESSVIPAEAGIQKTTVSEPEKKPAAVKPAAPAPTPAKTVPADWKRKLVIEEKEDKVLAIFSKSGGIPVFNSFTGTFAEAIRAAAGWVEELEVEWSKEEK